MRKITVLATILAFTCIATAVCAQSYSGLYFDQSATVVCNENAVGTPQVVYLVLHSPASIEGVIGWQATITADATIYVLGTTISGAGINLGNGGDYIVGLAAPLPSGQTVQLMAMNVVALSPGGLVLDALSGSSDIAPMFLSNLSPDTLAPMLVEFGGSGRHSLTFGQIDCPVSNLSGSPVAEELSSWGATKLNYR